MTSSGAVQGDNMNDPWNYHRCKLCSYKTRFLHIILRHVRRHRKRAKNHRFVCVLHSPEDYRCQRCELQTDVKVLLTEHFDTFHRAKETQHHPLPFLRYCENCDFQTYSLLVLLRHYSSCNRRGLPVKDENFIVCGKGNINSNQLTRADEKRNGFLLCSYCSFKTKSYHSLNIHLIWKHMRGGKKHSNQLKKKFGFVYCSYCSFRSKFINNLRCHMIYKHADQISLFKCEYCPYRTKVQNELRHHILSMHSQFTKMERFKCDRCPYETFGEENMKVHITYCKKYSFKCEHCSFQTNEKRNMVQHMLALHPETANFQCSHCSYESTSEKLLEEHIRSVHISLEDGLPVTDEDSIDFGEETIHSNQPTHTDEKENGYLHCSSNATTREELLEEHTPLEDGLPVTDEDSINFEEETIHSNQPTRTDEKENGYLHCSSNATTREELLEEHTPLEDGLPVADEDSINFEEETIHPLTNTNEKKNEFFQCHVSSKHSQFTKMKRLKCDHCSYQTKSNYCLKSHVMWRHTPAHKIRWCKCTHCSYKAKTKSSLRKHMVSKHGLFMKTFKCDLCPYETSMERNMEAHYTLCKEKNSLACENCSYKAKFKRALTRHILALHPETVEHFKCDHCSYETASAKLLEEHIRSVHIPLEDGLPLTDEDLIDFEEETIHSNQQTHTEEKENGYLHCSSNATTREELLEEHTPLEDGLPLTDEDLIDFEEETIHSNPLTRTDEKENGYLHCSSNATTREELLEEHTPLEDGLPVTDEDSINFEEETIHPLTNTNEKKNEFFQCHVSSKHSQFTKMKRLKCDHCSYQTKSNYRLKSHVMCRHTPAHKIHWCKCTHCSYKAKAKSSLRKHMVSKHGLFMKTFKCDLCPYETSMEGNMKKHYTLCKDKNSLACENCSYKTKFKSRLTRHILALHPETVEHFKCDHCSYKSTTKEILEKHIRDVHISLEENNEFRWIECKQCTFKTLRGGYLKEHMRETHWFICEYCSFGSKYKENLDRHMLRFHPENIEPKKLKYFRCDRCSYRAIREDLLEKHQRKMVTLPGLNNRSKCELCSFEANEECNMDQHILELHPDLVGWRKRSLMYAHMRKVPLFKCGQCSYRVKSNVALRKHIRLKHTPPDQITSPKSDRFSYEIIGTHGLKLQIRRVDTSSKEIDCSFQTNEKRNMVQHMLALHPETANFKCSLCSYETTSEELLEEHIRSVHIPLEDGLPVTDEDSIDFGEETIHSNQPTHTDEKENGYLHCSSYATTREELLEEHTPLECDLPVTDENSIDLEEETIHSNQPTHTDEKENGYLHCSSYATTREELLEEHTPLECDLPVTDENSIDLEEETVHSNQLTHTDEKENGYLHCSDCSYKTTSSKSLKFHMIGKHTRFFHCSYCSFKTERYTCLKFHILWKHTPEDQINWFKCEHCSFKTKTKSFLQCHKRLSHSQNRETNLFRCDQCPYETLKEQHMKAHITLCKKYSFKCQHCSFKAKRKGNLDKHMLTLHPETIRPIKCKTLKANRTESRYRLKEHKPLRQNRSDKVDWIKCVHCSYETASEKLLEEHIRSVHIPLEDGLPVTDEDSINFEEETIHPLTNTNEKKNEFFQCHVSSKHSQFTKMKRLKCDHCSYQTKSNYCLKSHVMFRHTPAHKIHWCKCTHCSYKAKTKSSLRKHMVSKHGLFMKTFKCDLCPYETSKERNMEAHYTLCKDKNSFACENCSHKAKFKSHLTRHILALHPETVEHFKCDHCSYETASEKLLEEHIRSVHIPLEDGLPLTDEDSINFEEETIHSNQPTHTDEKENGYLHCSSNATTREELLEEHTPLEDGLPVTDENSIHFEEETVHSNQLTHTDEKENGYLHCSDCSYKTTSSKSLKFHMIGKHTQRGKQLQNKSRFLHCSYCSFKTERYPCLKFHILWKHTPEDQINWFKCEHCSFKTKTKSFLQCHKRLSHSQNRETNLFRCDQCPYETLKEQHMKAHITLCKKYSFKCQHCSFKAKRKGNLDKHMLTLHPETIRPIKCKTLKANRTESRYRLKEHKLLRQNRSEKVDWIKCVHCSYQTKRKTFFDAHMRKEHIGWFKCDQCSFKVKDNNLKLREHILSEHSTSEQITWLMCVHCPYKTISSEALKTHTLLEHSKFKCQYCSFRTNKKDDLDKHMLKPHPENIDSKCFICDQCLYKTTSKKSLNLHVNRNHKRRGKKHSSQLTQANQKEKEFFYCNDCSYKTKVKGSLKSHVIFRHTPADEIDWWKCRRFL